MTENLDIPLHHVLHLRPKMLLALFLSDRCIQPAGFIYPAAIFVHWVTALSPVPCCDAYSHGLWRIALRCLVQRDLCGKVGVVCGGVWTSWAWGHEFLVWPGSLSPPLLPLLSPCPHSPHNSRVKQTNNKDLLFAHFPPCQTNYANER